MGLQGKGFFTYILTECEGGDPSAILATAQAAGLSHVLVKIADGPKAYGVSPSGNDFTLPVVQALRQAGIAVWGWHYVYGSQPVEEAAIAIRRVQELSLDGYVVDAEIEYKKAGKEKAAKRFMDEIRAVLAELPVALCSYRFPKYHPEFPWAVFLEKCDYNMPQVYWEQAHNPGWQLRESVRQCNALPNARPYLATGPTYGASGGWVPTCEDIKEFLETARTLGIEAVNFFSWDYCRKKLPALWKEIADHSWPVPPQTTGQPVAPLPSGVGEQPVSPGMPPVEAPAVPISQPISSTPPILDDFLNQYLAALKSRKPTRVAALYDVSAIHVRGDRVLRNPNDILKGYEDFFTTLTESPGMDLERTQISEDVHWATWKVGADTVYETIVINSGKITLHYTFTLPG